jgi:hydrogenase nickel incorporation protein HypA/HybF
VHEYSLVADLIRKAEAVAREQNARKVVGLRIRIGAASHLSPNHLRDHFSIAAAGSLVHGASLDIQAITNQADPLAREIVLESVELEF